MDTFIPDITGRLNNLGKSQGEGSIRLGLLGGTFDPIHMGHLRIAEEVREKLGFAGVLFIPAGNPVFKKDRVITDAQDRLRQVLQATESNPHFGVSALEVERPGDTFTIDTLRALREYYPPKVSFYFIVGSDAAASLPLWRDAPELAQLATFVLAGDRPGEAAKDEVRTNLETSEEFAIEYVPVRGLDISSSEIRKLAREGASIRYLVPDCIRNEVQRHFEGIACGGHDDKLRDQVDVLGDAYFEAFKQNLHDRVSEKRFQHSIGVSDTAQELARVYGLDVAKARLAGILHDWDKAYDDEGILLRVEELGMQDMLDPTVVRTLPAVLHGLTAARALAQEHPELPSDIIQAIERHTIADENMEPLDMVIYIADALEPNRRYGEIDELRQLIGQVELEELFFKVFYYWIRVLLDRERTIYPDTIRIWNAYATKLHPREGFTGHDCRS